MNSNQTNLAVEVMTQLLQDNVGNRITAALANGMLQALHSELSKAIAVEGAKANGMHLGDISQLNGEIVKG